MDAEPIRIPVEVETEPPVFDIAPRGYDRGQVDEHIVALEQELAELTWQREWLEAKEGELAADRERLDAERAEFDAERDAWEPSFARLGDRVEEILRDSRAEADAMVAAAEQKCERRRARDREEAEAERAVFAKEAAEARAELSHELEVAGLRADSAAAGVLQAARRDAEEMRRAARQEAETIRMRAAEALAAARRERGKAAVRLAELAERVRAMSDRLTEPDERVPVNGSSPRRLVVLTDPALEGDYDSDDAVDQSGR